MRTLECGFFASLVLRLVRVAGFGASLDLREARLDHRQVDVLSIEKDHREQPLVAVDSVDLYRHTLSLGALFEKCLCFWA